MAHALAALLGLPILMHPDVRSWRWPAKAAAAFAFGAIVLAVEATALAFIDGSWSMANLVMPPLLLAFVLARRDRRRGPSPAPPFRPGRTVAIFAAVATGTAFLQLGFALATARATSVDFLLFWGVKAVRFALAKSVDPKLLSSNFFGHTQPFYPPLVPVLDAWSVLLAGHMPWRAASLVALLWFGATAILLLEIARSRIGDRNAALVTAFWVAAMGPSLAFSFSGANGEAPLLLYETVGGLLLMTEGERPTAGRRFLAGLFLAGAVLTKVEGSIGSALMILGALLRHSSARRLRWRRIPQLILPPTLAGLLWARFVWNFGIPSNYAGRGRLFEFRWDRLLPILGSMARQFEAGSWWLSWILPLTLIFAGSSRRSLRRALPGVVAIVGLISFFVLIYLHEPGDLAVRIGWEIPRISQPILSLMILVAAVSTMAGVPTHTGRDLGDGC